MALPSSSTDGPPRVLRFWVSGLFRVSDSGSGVKGVKVPGWRFGVSGMGFWFGKGLEFHGNKGFESCGLSEVGASRAACGNPKPYKPNPKPHGLFV